MTRIVVGHKDEIPPGERKLVEYKGGQVGVFNVDGEYIAVRNYCPHHGAPICLGLLSGTFVPSEPQKLEYGMDDRILICPWHHWQFDLHTGTCLTDSRMRLKTYEVRVEGEELVVLT
jgi:nitrite reductase (NADH) small subunit